MVPPKPSLQQAKLDIAIRATVEPTICGRLILAFYKIRWPALVLIPVLAYLALVVICGLRLQESGLRDRMLAAADMLTTPPITEPALDEWLQRYGAVMQPTATGTIEKNRTDFIGLLNGWQALKPSDYPGTVLKDLAKFLSPETNDEPGGAPIAIPTPSDARGDYRNFQIDLRVNRTGDTTKKQVVDDAEWLVRTYARARESSGILSDGNTALWPADEYRFYDYKRDCLNRIVLGGLVAALGALALLIVSSLRGFEPPTWRQIFRERTFQLSGKGRSTTPYDADAKVAMLSNAWLWLALLMIVTIQYRQMLERKELWLEGWVNHPASFIIILCFVLSLGISFRSLSKSRQREFFLEDYLNHFRQHNWTLLCVPVAAIVVLRYSYSTLMPTDPTRAWIQIGIGTIFALLSLASFVYMIRSIRKITCRRDKDAPSLEHIRLGDHLQEIFLPRIDQTLPLQLLTATGTILTFVTFGSM